MPVGDFNTNTRLQGSGAQTGYDIAEMVDINRFTEIVRPFRAARRVDGNRFEPATGIGKITQRQLRRDRRKQVAAMKRRRQLIRTPDDFPTLDRRLGRRRLHGATDYDFEQPIVRPNEPSTTGTDDERLARTANNGKKDAGLTDDLAIGTKKVGRGSRIVRRRVGE